MHPSDTLHGGTYPDELRELIKRAFGTPRPINASRLPGGPLPQRLATGLDEDDRLVASPECEVGSDATVIASAEYWELALPHRLLIVGPLIDIADSGLSQVEMAAVESRLITSYRNDYGGLPLPRNLLLQLADADRERPQDYLPAWLEGAREIVMAADTTGEARRRRLSLRAEAIHRCAIGTCSEAGTQLAEFCADVITLCHAASLDLRRAFALAHECGGSVSKAMARIANAGDSETERLIPHLLKAELSLDDFPHADRCRVVELAARRRGPVTGGQEPAVPTLPGSRKALPIGSPERADNESVREEPTTDARVLYRDILSHLLEKIRRPAIAKRLALVGVMHELGVRQQPILLCGATGSGKSYAALALAEVLKRPYLRIEMPDCSPSGWKGLNIPDALSMLADRSTDGLKGGVLILEEVDKVRIQPGVDGNSLQWQQQMQSSMLGLLGGALSTPEWGGAKQFDCSELLVLGTGAFDGRFVRLPPTTQELVAWGWLPETAARWGERICIEPPNRSEASDLLERSDRSVTNRFGPVARAFGVEISVSREALNYVVDLWFRSGSDFRSASEWLLAAARSRLLGILEEQTATSIILVPDDIQRVAPTPPGQRGH